MINFFSIRAFFAMFFSILSSVLPVIAVEKIKTRARTFRALFNEKAITKANIPVITKIRIPDQEEPIVEDFLQFDKKNRHKKNFFIPCDFFEILKTQWPQQDQFLAKIKPFLIDEHSLCQSIPIDFLKKLEENHKKNSAPIPSPIPGDIVNDDQETFQCLATKTVEILIKKINADVSLLDTYKKTIVELDCLLPNQEPEKTSREFRILAQFKSIQKVFNLYLSQDALNSSPIILPIAPSSAAIGLQHPVCNTSIKEILDSFPGFSLYRVSEYTNTLLKTLDPNLNPKLNSRTQAEINFIKKLNAIIEFYRTGENTIWYYLAALHNLIKSPDNT